MDVSVGDVREAAGRIAGYVRRTPVMEVSPGLLLKLEGMQHSGSFKVRGGFNRVLTAGELPEAGVIAASGGNHGLAVAYVARALGVRAEIFVPTVSSPVKVAGLRALGAEVTQTGAVYAEAYEASVKRAAESGALEIHAYDQAEVVAGQGTVGLEVLEQTGGVDTVLVAVGGGGLVAGITAAVAGRARVVAVEPELIPTLHRALEAGGPVRVEVSGVGADALGASRIGAIGYAVTAAAGVRSVLVSDEAIVEARREMWRSYRIAAEHAGAAAFAALRSGAYTPAPDERVAVIVCGANTDPATLL
ncbi:threonine/serine dehydratase [Streptosporangium roseum]|uniref:Threonine dehydratase n=1 Tax=Streptosporangium roseum (strain ATCC 12428 / DSM 43021 / JCM 3005 / KCTC 9067 / NCIMB 10171 / NRRL 2505 / NI 9100) TaxID=479432 RepID=D2B379_STRRD|nr:threonine/serine dehydratase [Streptosporangium roseum]ACZ85559.1 threonine dehydratase [Streptosporangium roseum DSM 43021]